MEQFLSRLEIYIKFPATALSAAMGEIIVKMMVEILSTIALVTKQINQKRSRKSALSYWTFGSTYYS